MLARFALRLEITQRKLSKRQRKAYRSLHFIPWPNINHVQWVITYCRYPLQTYSIILRFGIVLLLIGTNYNHRNHTSGSTIIRVLEICNGIEWDINNRVYIISRWGQQQPDVLFDLFHLVNYLFHTLTHHREVCCFTMTTGVFQTVTLSAIWIPKAS